MLKPCLPGCAYRTAFRAAVLCALLATSAAGGPTSSVIGLPPPTVTPGRIEMDTFFGGAAVQLQGEAPGAEEVVVAILGPEESQAFKHKERFGPVWLSSGQMHFSGIPSLWFVFASSPIESLLPLEPVRKHLLDRGALLSRIHIDPTPDDIPRFQSEYMRWKANFGLYAEHPDAVRTEPSTDGHGIRYSLDFDWPKVAAPATYHITVYAIAGQEIVGKSEIPFEVVKVGLPDRISSLSTSRAGLYGFGCILLAAAAGFGMDKLVALMGGKRTSH